MPELARTVAYDEDRRLAIKGRIGAEPSLPYLLKFEHNPVAKLIEQDDKITEHATRSDVSWQDHSDFVKKLYREVLKKDKNYLAYLQLPQATTEQHYEIVLHIAKEIFFKDDTMQSFLEDQFTNWEENKKTVKSLVLKSIKSIAKENYESVSYLSLSPDWQEDQAFMKELYDKTVNEGPSLEPMLKSLLDNWELDRLSAVDTIMIKMAICEMLYFPSVPVKVTINEFIEMSKIYGTPKSKEFVNGILDSAVSLLTKEGRLRKSGRGLMDNQ